MAETATGDAPAGGGEGGARRSHADRVYLELRTRSCAASCRPTGGSSRSSSPPSSRRAARRCARRCAGSRATGTSCATPGSGRGRRAPTCARWTRALRRAARARGALRAPRRRRRRPRADRGDPQDWRAPARRRAPRADRGPDFVHADEAFHERVARRERQRHGGPPAARPQRPHPGPARARLHDRGPRRRDEVLGPLREHQHVATVPDRGGYVAERSDGSVPRR